ncbi:uncharacterized protein BO97DRAFT_418013 [Aspergillus homomorphus CBS 101889]|uniref:Uncharacterized protein n=1 Tax=Aspergillus homomorphus (strain CBS 101889) TaxID=1450537 RepID=A0A395HKI8_ASPHC|nr:hypothetical protein BO97DRAFT_418013 [Aspergillus homomorphus CBS 101889]RAL08019.1 hypothetical protein BO97DRAFT_418013 [Aspergillus homomorphus CBS 101889]
MPTLVQLMPDANGSQILENGLTLAKLRRIHETHSPSKYGPWGDRDSRRKVPSLPDWESSRGISPRVRDAAAVVVRAAFERLGHLEKQMQPVISRDKAPALSTHDDQQTPTARKRKHNSTSDVSLKAEEVGKDRFRRARLGTDRLEKADVEELVVRKLATSKAVLRDLAGRKLAVRKIAAHTSELFLCSVSIAIGSPTCCACSCLRL